MATIPWITTQRLKDNSIISLNVDEKILSVAIKNATDFSIYELLGTKLYKKVKNQVDTNTLTGDTKVLFDDYIVPALIQYSMVEAIPLTFYKIRPAGSVNLKADNADIVSEKDITYWSEYFKNKAQTVGNRLVKYLIQNSTLFPEYDTNGNYDEDQPLSTAYKCPIFFEKKNRGRDDMYLRKRGIYKNNY